MQTTKSAGIDILASLALISVTNHSDSTLRDAPTTQLKEECLKSREMEENSAKYFCYHFVLFLIQIFFLANGNTK